MDVASISNTLTSLGQDSNSTVSNSKAFLNQDDFLQLLTTQLKNQSPLNPVDNNNFSSQLAQFSTLAGVEKLNTSIQQMLQMQQLSQGSQLVGRTVTYGDTAASAARGKVDSVEFLQGNLILHVGGEQITAEQVRTILS